MDTRHLRGPRNGTPVLSPIHPKHRGFEISTCGRADDKSQEIVPSHDVPRRSNICCRDKFPNVYSTKAHCHCYFGFFAVDLCFFFFLVIAGLQAELFYVREGVINEYAIKFVVPVPAQVHKLHFTWENLAGRPVS